jgi:vWA-MoxR associated protein C-terminal domain
VSFASREGFTVRVLRRGTAVPAGVGFVAGARHIVTCAHVVNVALGRDQRDQERPGLDARVQVDFPMLGGADGGPSRTCRVEAWSPPPLSGVSGGDVAGMVVVGEGLPAEAGPARLIDLAALRDVAVRVFGYPEEPHRRPNGAWAASRLRGVVGGGIVQLDAEGDSVFRAQSGYSGSPVVYTDKAGDAVLGMLTAASDDSASRDAYAIQLPWLAAVWPEVLGGGLLVDRALADLVPELAQRLTTRHDALRLIHEVASAAGAALPTGVTDVTVLLEHLASLLVPPGQGIPPLIALSEHVGQQEQEPAARTEFSLLSGRWADRVPGGHDRLAEAWESLASQGGDSGQECLVVRLDRDSNLGCDSNGDRLYRLSLCMFRNGRDGEPLPLGSEASVTFEEIRQQLVKLLPDVIQTVNRSSLTVEFVVPRELLNEDFDQWLIPEAPAGGLDHEYLLGARYPVVVRDLARMILLSKDGGWKARWRRLVADTQGTLADAVFWIDPQAIETYRQVNAALLSAEGQVCLALLAAPLANSHIAELLSAGLMAGIPAAIWLRQSCGSQDKEDLAAALDPAGLRILPQHVLYLRRQAEVQASASHCGRHLTLLWDNPDRLWEPPPFTQPPLARIGTAS